MKYIIEIVLEASRFKMDHFSGY